MIMRDASASCAVAVGASAGGLAALECLLSGLPDDFPAAVLVVQHLDRRHPSLLPELMARYARLPVRPAKEGDVIEGGTVYIGVPDLHLQAGDHQVRLADTPLVHFTRPSVDRLFQSVAVVYGRSAIGVILTGTGADGADGVVAVHAAGGTTIVQDPKEAAYPGMPRAAVATGCVDYVLPLVAIAPALVRLVATPGKVS